MAEQRPWATVDGVSLVTAAAALQLLPENVHRVLPLEVLAAVGASLPVRGNAPRLSPSRLRALLKDSYIRENASGQDPYDDVYTDEVPYHGGPHLVVQGLTSRSALTAKTLLQAVFGPTGAALPDAFKRDAHLLTVVILRISDAVCRSAGLRRGVEPPEQRTSVFVPGAARLTELCRAVTFDLDRLGALLPEFAIPSLLRLTVAPGEYDTAKWGPPTDGLVVQPFIGTADGIVVAAPGELAAALRHHLVLLAGEHECRDALADAYRQVIMYDMARLLQLTGCRPLGDWEKTRDPLIVRRRMTMPGDKYVDLAVVTDSLDGYSAHEPYGAVPVDDLGQRIEAVVEPPGGTGPEDHNTLKLVVHDHMARSVFLGFTGLHETGPLLAITPDDLRVILETGGDEPLALWNFARVRNQFYEDVRVMSWSVLDDYSIYEEHSDSFYMSDEGTPTFATIAVASGLALRVKAYRRADRHWVRSLEGSGVFDVLALHGSDISPIYFPPASTELPALLVELGATQVWVTTEAGFPPDVQAFMRSVKESVAFWVWQLYETRREWLTDLDENRLRVNITCDDPRAWETILAGAEESKAADTWIEFAGRSRGLLSLRLNSAGAGWLRSEHNEADRLLVSQLLTETSADLADSGNALRVLDSVAPLGPKRMISVASARDVPLRPGSLPRPRLLQPAVSSMLLDELGEWLCEDRGHKQGEIPDSHRTTILREVVDHYFGLLVGLFETLSPDELVSQLIVRDEALVRAEAMSAHTLPTRIACFGESTSMVDDLVKEEKRRVESAVASRFLVEYAAAIPPRGTEPLTLDRYDRLLALAAELVSRATLSDAIHHGFSESRLSILPSKRLGVSRGDRYEAGTNAVAAAWAESRRKIGLEVDPIHDGSSEEMFPASEVQAAMRAEVGFDLTDLATCIGEMINFGDENCVTDPYVVSNEAIRDHLQSSLNWPREKVDRLLAEIMLAPREDFLSVGSDAWPWRYNRVWSYLRRPVIFLSQTSSDEKLVYGARRLWYAGRYWLDLVYSGRFRAHSAEMKSLMGRIRQQHNRSFEKRVADSLKRSGCCPAVQGLKRLNGHRLESHQGDDLGDIDALGIDVGRRLIVVAEAKDFEIARTPPELGNEADDLIRGEKSALVKLGRRVEWVKAHLRDVLRHFDLELDESGWSVVGVVVTSRDLISPRVLSTTTTVIPIDKLGDWLSRLGSRSHRR